MPPSSLSTVFYAAPATDPFSRSRRIKHDPEEIDRRWGLASLAEHVVNLPTVEGSA
jgi:hypothetical protein